MRSSGLKFYPKIWSFWLFLVNQKLRRKYPVDLRHNFIKESVLRSPTNFKKGLFTKTLYKLIYFCLINKKGRFYYIIGANVWWGKEKEPNTLAPLRSAALTSGTRGIVRVNQCSPLNILLRIVVCYELSPHGYKNNKQFIYNTTRENLEPLDSSVLGVALI